ncbi:MAG TPA: adenylate/guanylate cyclase domain-containing protein [Polyangiales bacterium]|nr:adenylate/guanylate cyclase domain-containing protein [Polyangiales bacterium]
MIETSLLGGTKLAHAGTVPELDSLPVMQWLSETLQREVQASFETLRAGLRFARERLFDNQLASRPLAQPLTTLLATDLEDFTPMIERLGDMRAQEIMHAHNELMRSCLRRHGGREVAHTGDGIMAAFRSAENALRCAIAMQRGLTEHNRRHPLTPLRARIGLHAGMPLPEEDRLFGSCVNITVRVCSVTKAGRILVSDTVLGQLGPNGFRFREHGYVKLKGISAPQQLHELAWEPSLPEVLN